MITKSFSAVLIFALSACSPFSPKIYDWSAYETAMLAEVGEPGNFNRLDTIQQLQESLDKTPTAQIPPGALTHLAFLMEESGLSAEAKVLIEREAVLFPETQLWSKKLVAHK